jgi:hypothetical protein
MKIHPQQAARYLPRKVFFLNLSKAKMWFSHILSLFKRPSGKTKRPRFNGVAFCNQSKIFNLIIFSHTGWHSRFFRFGFFTNYCFGRQKH